MTHPHALVIRAPGTNCDVETAHAFELAGAQSTVVHINRLLEDTSLLDGKQIFCIPGGFSYGDDIGAGRIMAQQLRNRLGDALHAFVAAGNCVLGICNGFQALLQTGLLVADNHGAKQTTSLALNDVGVYQDRWVELDVTSSQCVFLQGIQQMYLPVAHAEGRFVVSDEGALQELKSNDQIALTYVNNTNPNGSIADIAGICDPTGRVMGLMPHPERFIHRTQHPRWTREDLPEEGDGLAIFRNAVRHFSENHVSTH